MKKRLLLLTLCLLLCLCACGKTEFVAYDDASEALLTERSSAFEQLNTVDMDGNAVTAENLSENRLNMINAWATWCVYCVKEMPHLQELSAWAEELDVGVWGLLVESGAMTGAILPGLSEAERAAAGEILSTAGAAYPQLLVSEDMLPYLSDLYSFPTTYFVDSQGRPVGEPVLGARDLAGWQAEVEARLEMLENE